MPPIDWLHLAAVALGAVGTFFLRARSGTPTGTAPAGLIETLLKALESRLSLTTLGPGGQTIPNPLLTIRVLLVPETPANPK